MPSGIRETADLPGFGPCTVLRRSDRHFICRGTDPADGAGVVVKVTATDAGPEVVAALRHEHELLAGLVFPGVVRTRGLRRFGDDLALVLEDGGPRTLADVVAAGPLAIPAFLELAIALAGTLAAVHGAGVIHRDLNPSNVAIREDGTHPTLIDFGLATSVATAARVERVPWELEGTLPYLSPEQTGRTGRVIDHRTDLYALGATFYELLTGAPPFATADPVEVVHAHLARAPRSPAEVRPEVPAAVAAIVLKLLEKDPEARYQTARGLAHDLERARAGGGAPFPLGEADRPRDLRIPDTLVGRDAEAARLEAALAGGCGGARTLVALAGDAGAGKTTLATRGLAAAARAGATVIAGKFEAARRDVPYHGLAQAIGHHARQMMAAPGPLFEAWRGRVQAAIAPTGRVLVEAVPALGEALGEQPAVPELEPTEARNRFATTFARLLGALAPPGEPVVALLDDLHWADPASLDLLAELAAEEAGGCVHLVGTYRDREVGADHPLVAALAAFERAGGALVPIALGPLAVADVAALCAEALGAAPSEVAPLARAIHRRAGGNAFFVRRLLATAHADGTLRFDEAAGRWRWSAEAIAHGELGEDVVGLLIADLGRMPAASRELLQVAAGVGHEVDLGLLAAVAGRSLAATADDLWPAVTQGLLEPLQGADRAPRRDGPLDDRLGDLKLGFRFAHDRIQQAAYALVEPAERPRLHLKIGWLMLDACGGGQDGLFDVAEQLNAGAELLVTDAERLTVARLDLDAARKARASAAPASARAFAMKGLAILPADAWTREPGLAFALHRVGAEAAFAEGERAEGDRLVAAALPHAPGAAEAADLEGLRVVAAASAGAFAEALAIGGEGLARLGMALPTGDPRAALAAELAAVDAAIRGRPIEALADAPEARAPEVLAATKLLSDLYVPAYVLDPPRMALQIARSVRLALEHGRTPQAAEGFAQLALVLLGEGAGAEARVDAYGRLALELARRGGNPAQAAKALTVVAGTLHHWQAPVRTSASLAREAAAAAEEGGDRQFAAYAASALLYALFDAGVPLDEVDYEAEVGAAVATRAGNRLVGDVVAAYRQAVAAWRTDAPPPAAPADAAPTARFLAAVLALRLAVVAGDPAAARAHAEAARVDLGAVAGLFATADLVFLEALARAADPPAADDPARAAWAAALGEAEARLAAWAARAPANFAHKAALVAAERARGEGRPWDALAAYDRAVDGARDEGFLHDEALAGELAGRWLYAMGRHRAARSYVRGAAIAYRRWGADAKVAALERAFPTWVGPAAGPTEMSGTARTTTMSSTGTRRLDAISLLKAAQALSGETEVDRLLELMLALAIEAAGATRGALLLAEGGDLVVRARGTVAGEVALGHEPLDACTDLPHAILRFAWRAAEPVVLAHAAREPHFADDPVVARGLRSVLCLPIADQGRRRGLLYMENDQLVGAFGPERGEVLRLLAAQMAIALENALLLADLRQAAVVIENSPIVLIRWRFGRTMPVEYVSENVERVLGVSRADLLANVVTFDELIHPEDWPRVLAQYEAVMKAGERVVRFAYRAVRPDGAIRWIEATSTFEQDAEGRPSGIQGVLADVTERRLAEEERTASLMREQAARAEVEAAHELDQMKTTFVNAVSHDLRTPLTSITGYAEFLEDELGGPLSEQQREFVTQIQKSTKRLEGLVNDLLDVARLDAGTFQLKPEEGDLAQRIGEALEAFRPQAQAAKVDLAAELPDGPLPLRLDVARVDRVLANLIGNALKFTPAGGAIRVRARREGAEVRCEVEDTGPGIEPADAARLFQRFVQLDAGKRKGGTGLGLSIAKAVVEAHGGRIGVESAPGAGATFWFTLPAQA